MIDEKMKTIGLLCLIAGAILFIRQLVRLKKGKTTKCDCGGIFPTKNDDSKKPENKN